MASRIRRTKEEIALGLSLEEVKARREASDESGQPKQNTGVAPKKATANKKTKADTAAKPEKAKRKPKAKSAKAEKSKDHDCAAVGEGTGELIEEPKESMNEGKSQRLIRKIAAEHEIKPRELRKQIETLIEARTGEVIDFFVNGVEYRASECLTQTVEELVEELQEGSWIFCCRLMDGVSLRYYYLFMRAKK